MKSAVTICVDTNAALLVGSGLTREDQPRRLAFFPDGHAGGNRGTSGRGDRMQNCSDTHAFGVFLNVGVCQYFSGVSVSLLNQQRERLIRQ